MKNTLYELFKMAQKGRDVATIELYNKFLPCIKGFGRRLFYDEAETDLTIYLLEFIKNVNLKIETMVRLLIMSIQHLKVNISI